VLFINGELDYQEGKNQNSLRTQDIEKIVNTFNSYPTLNATPKSST
jgi:type I restriction enzyme M protein